MTYREYKAELLKYDLWTYQQVLERDLNEDYVDPRRKRYAQKWVDYCKTVNIKRKVLSQERFDKLKRFAKHTIYYVLDD